MDVIIAPDYPLNGDITHFEAYMFSTTERHMAAQTFHKEEIIIVEGKGKASRYSMEQLDNRRKAKRIFNKCAKERIEGFPLPDNIGCCLIDFSDDEPFDESEYKHLRAEIAIWAMENDRVLALAPHFGQANRPPHLHILYQRAQGKHDELQDYLLAQGE